MSFGLDDLLSKSSLLKHHAILLLSRPFGDSGLNYADFAQIAKAFCDINIYGEGEEFWQAAARHPDVFVACRERDTLRLEDVAPIRQRALYPPNIAKRRLFFIDRVNRLNLNAANSLLKTLEEPNAKSLFLFTARSGREVLSTISSRCQKIPIQFPVAASFDASKILETEDFGLLENLLKAALSGNSLVLESNWDNASGASLPIASLAQIAKKAYEWAKKYSPDDLRETIVFILSQAYKSNLNYESQIRFITSDLRQWKNCEAMHPSSEFWLSRILLRAR